MNSLFENLTNPALLFFMLGILAVQLKNDLKIPENSSKFISIYLLFSIGFKGGNELSHSSLTAEITGGMLVGIVMAAIVPIIAFFILKNRVNVKNAGAIAAAYGSVSAVTFVTTISFLDFEGVEFDGFMIAVMAMMEAPAIVIGLFLIKLFSDKSEDNGQGLGQVFLHSLNNASVFLILGSLIIGFVASDEQARGIEPFTTDIFKGFLAIFLLDMGIRAGEELGTMLKNGWFIFLFACLMPFINGFLSILLASLVTDSAGNLLLFAVLGASASYIAVPAALKNAVPEANPGLYLPMALGITFPINIIVGIPFYYYVIQNFLMG